MKIDTKIIETLLTTAVLLLGAMPVFIPTVQAFPPDIITEKWYFKIRDYAPSEYWAYNSSFTSAVTPVAANLDDDPQLEVIVSAGYNNINANFWGVVVCVDGETGAEMWSFSEDYLGNHCCVELGDIDGDGDLEAIIAGYAQIVAIHAENGTEIWRYTRPEVGASLCKPTIIADIDGTTYVYHTLADTTLAIRKAYANNGTEAASYSLNVGPCMGGLSAADINNDGKLEILLPSTHAQSGLLCFDEDLNLLWNHASITCSGGTPVLRDVNGDGYLDVIVLACSSSGSGWVGVVDGSDGTLINWPASSMGFYVHDGPTVYDIDGDGGIEIFTQCQTQGKIQVWDITNWQWETNLTEANVTTSNQNPVLANVYGDSDLEIIHSSNGNDWDDRGMRFWSSDYTFIGQDTTMYSKQFIVFDVDDDGLNEMIGIGTRDGFGGFVQCCDTEGATLGARLENVYYSERRNPVEEYAEGLLEEPESETGGVGRIISATHDDIYTFIRNSNGKYWEANADNIQVAINDLDNTNGVVWLPGNKKFTITSTIIIHPNITLDMGGCSFYTTNNIDVVDMRDGSIIRNGNIDVSDVGSSFDKSAIVINAVNYIDDGVEIYEMNLESKGPLGIAGSYGRGTGIYLHATDANVPQKICNVRCKGLYTRDFYYGIRIHNERHPLAGENGAIINGNTFTDLISMADSYYIHISRDTSIDLDKCNISGNYFNLLQYQTGMGGWYGGEHFTWTIITSDGYGNSFNNIMIWDWGEAEGDHAVVLTSDSSHCYVMARGGPSTWINNGEGNTIFDTGSGVLTIDLTVTGE